LGLADLGIGQAGFDAQLIAKRLNQLRSQGFCFGLSILPATLKRLIRLAFKKCAVVNAG
jgi:hypothetical protein